MQSVFLSGQGAPEALCRVIFGDSAAPIPASIAHGGTDIQGIVLTGVDQAGLDRLAFLSEVLGWTRQSAAVTGAGGTGPVLAFLALGTVADPPADLLALSADILRLRGILPSERLRARLSTLRVKAASRVRAQNQRPMPPTGQGRREVNVASSTQSHFGFFAVETLALRFRRFDGQMSAPITREVFVAGDAVTVLPYDPVRDRVLVIEQFRAGPLGRGDRDPWQIEAIAGRIDPGETPEECARREALEEAGLVLGRVLPVASYYPSPGAVTEYLYSYIALCDLPDGCAGVFGVAEEAEDIRGHLLAFDDLMARVGNGDIDNAPLLLTALWLQRERACLRQ